VPGGRPSAEPDGGPLLIQELRNSAVIRRAENNEAI
jgi:hypothetical protein